MLLSLPSPPAEPSGVSTDALPAHPYQPDDRLAAWLAPDLGEVVVRGALAEARASGRPLVDVLVARGIWSEAAAYAALASFGGYPFVDLAAEPPSPTAARLVPERVARRYHVVPIAEDDRTLTYAGAGFYRDEVDRDVAFASGRRPRFVVASRSQVARAIELAYPPGADTTALIERLRCAAGAVATSDEADLTEGAVVGRHILGAALAAGASEVQIEPGARGAFVRHRVCGILEPLVALPTSAVAGVTNAFKAQGHTDLASRHRPQAGAFRVSMDGRTADVRLSVLPTIHGEKLLLRVIDSASPLPGLETLGSPDHARQPLVDALSRPDGLVLIAGPAGVGKTSTLYSAVAHLHAAGRPVVTIEDPVERRLDGVSQVAVNPKAGATCAAVLRSVMRQGSRAIMVGDIRDGEVAALVGQATGAGRLVLGAVSTVDAASAVMRLLNLGLSPAQVADGLNAVVAQRLLRALCPDCRLVHDQATARRIGEAHGVAAIAASPGEGCERCGFTGYVGRVPVVEALVSSDEVRCLIHDGAGAADLRAAMARAGEPSMLAGAMHLVERGMTSMDEVDRVLREHGDAARNAARVTQTPTILVIDDDRMVRVLARRLLESSGYRTIDADSGASGLAVARRERPDLVVLDGDLPDLPWPRTLEILRRDVFLSAVPVMILTPGTDPASAPVTLARVADDYLVKPFAPEMLVARVGAVLRRARRYAS